MEIADVSRALFEVPAVRDVCVELPDESLTEAERQPPIASGPATAAGTIDHPGIGNTENVREGVELQHEGKWMMKQQRLRD